MRKAVGWWLGILLLLSACGEKEAGVTAVRIQDATVIEQTWAAEDPESRELQRNLARWYNVNLYSPDPDPDYQLSYAGILFYEDGIMGYVQLPTRDGYIPIYHADRADGFAHDPYSAFPIGRKGDHTVLTCREEIMLKQGETIILWVMGEPMIYVVGQTGTDTCTLQCGQTQYICGRVMENPS